VKKPKLIFINRYYFPDSSATALLLTHLAEKLVEQYFCVCIITSRQLYERADAKLPPNEIINGVEIRRVWSTRFGRTNLIGRAFDYISFYIACFFYLLIKAKQKDIIIANTDPPMVSVVAAAITKIKRNTLINWLQDVFPEIAYELAHKPTTSFSYYILKHIRNWSLRAASKNVALGQLMSDRVNTYTKQPEKTQIIPNWVISKQSGNIPHDKNFLRSEWNLEGKLAVGYSGNLGRAHDYLTFFQSALSLKESRDIIFLFIGGGAGMRDLKKIVNDARLENVIFKPYQPTEHLHLSLAAIDIHLASLDPNLEGLIVPSKLYGILAAARPILFVGDKGGEIGRLIEKNHCGKAVAVGDAQILTDQIKLMSQDAEYCRKLGDNARALFQREFGDGKSIQRWVDLFKSLPS
jgi:colanic acid biosynthesis glycosyl transferase WcaI